MAVTGTRNPLIGFFLGCVFLLVSTDLEFTCRCCHAQECAATIRQQPRALVGGEFVTIDESRFSKHVGTYPPSGTSQEQLQPDSDDNSSLQYFVLNAEKPVLYVTNFLNQSIADELKDFCISGSRFIESNIRGANRNDDATVEKSKLRTSESCTMVPTVLYRNNPKVQAMFAQDPMPPHVAKIAREVDISWDVAVRASQILGVDPNTVEPLQLVRYMSPDAQYQLHHDHGGYYGKTTELRPWTMLVFLNDVSEGGHTAFPKLDLEVVPRFGDALIWSNVKQEADGGPFLVDADMVHAGKPPVKDGIEKYAMNIWFGFESSQERIQEGKWSSSS